MWIDGIWIDRYEESDTGGTPPDPPEEPDPPDPPPEEPPKPPPMKTKYLAQLKKDFAAENADELAEIAEETQGLAEYALNSKRKLDRAIIVPDKDNPDPEELKKFREQIGLPDSSDDYTLDSGDVEIPEELTAGIRTMAFSGSLSKRQAQTVYAFIAEQVKSSVEAKTTSQQEVKEGFDTRLVERFGGNEGKATEAKNLYLAALKRMAGLVPDDEGFSQRLIDSGLFYDASFVRAVALTEQHMGDHEFIEGGDSGFKKGKKKTGGKMVHYSPEWLGSHGG